MIHCGEQGAAEKQQQHFTKTNQTPEHPIADKILQRNTPRLHNRKVFQHLCVPSYQQTSTGRLFSQASLFLNASSEHKHKGRGFSYQSISVMLHLTYLRRYCGYDVDTERNDHSMDIL